MYKKLKVALVIPAHNEERLIVPTLENVPKTIDKVYVMDDASTDKTAEIVKNCHSEFRGSFSQHADIIGEFIKRLEKGTLVLVKGSRGMKMEKIVQALVEKFKKD